VGDLEAEQAVLRAHLRGPLHSATGNIEDGRMDTKNRLGDNPDISRMHKRQYFAHRQPPVQSDSYVYSQSLILE
jgi:hypothetical protein